MKKITSAKNLASKESSPEKSNQIELAPPSVPQNADIPSMSDEDIIPFSPHPQAETISSKHRSFKRRPPVLPDDYRKLRTKIPAEDKKNHSERWIRVQEMRRGLIRPLRQNLATKNLNYTSHTYFNNLWAEAHVNLRSLLKEEKTRGTIAGSDLKQMFTILSEIFYKYLIVYKKMNETYDQMVHPQKRILVRKSLDLVITRLLEIRAALVSTESSEFYYFDELSYTEKIPPSEFDVPIPTYYYYDPPEQLVLRDRWYENIKEKNIKDVADRLALEKRIQFKLVEGEKWTKTSRVINDDDILIGGGSEEAPYIDQASIIMIQAMERARQGRMRYRVAKYLHDEEERAKTRKLNAKKQYMDVEKAVVIIQKIIRGFLARVRVRRQREEELELLGIRWTTPNESSLRGRAQLKCLRNEEELERAKERRRVTRRRNQKLFEEAQITILNRLRLIEAPDMAEEFKFQLRTWMLDIKETTGKLPSQIPKAEFGGSRFFICPDQLSDEVREKGKEATGKDQTKKSKQDRKKDKDNKKKDKKQVVKKKGQDLSIPKLDQPAYLDELVAVNTEYNRVWRGRNESENPDQKHEEHFIIHEKRGLIGDEVREQVDTALRAELALLKQALERKKGKKGKTKSKKRGKGRKGKAKRKGKRKKGKDMTPDRDLKSLVKELYDHNILQSYPTTRLDSLIGSCSLINGELRSFFSQNPHDPNTQNEERPMPGDANPLPTFGDVKRAIKDCIILPLGSQTVHQLSPHTKSVLICGPEGCGKKTLVNAICTELHATLFDLTADNIVGKYPGKPGLKMLIHLIDKVGHALAPVVLKIDNCEKTYMKKVPKTDKTEPRRLKKQLGKMLKTFQPGDQTILVGLSSEPWVAPFKLLKKDYQKIIYIPRPEYATRIQTWRNLLLPHSTFLHQDVHFSLLTKLSDGWTVGVIKKVVNSAIENHKKLIAKDETDKKYQNEDDPFTMMATKGAKISSVGKKFIHMDKFLEELSNYDPVFIEQEKAWNTWFNKTPLQKNRLANQSGSGGGAVKGEKKKSKKKRRNE